MSSLIVSHDSHLMMLEIAVENLFVPWTSEFDKVILKKTIVMFRMLDEEWTSLAPNRRDHRPYRGSCCENENFYGGKSVIFCVPARFFEKKAIDVDVQLYVQREMCKYFEMDSCQNVGFATVSVDDLLNGIAKQMRERNELSEHLSDLYKQQIISRSTTGTYNLLDENFRNTAATISLYIRISCLGKCLVTEITRIESGMYGAFCARREPDKEQYLVRQLTPDELQSGHWDVRDLPRIPRGRLVCRCEELRKKDLAVDLAARKKRRREPTARSANADRFVTTSVTTNAARDAVGIAKTRIPIAKAPADVAIIKREEALADYGALGDADVDTLADAQERIVVTDAAAIAADTAAIAADTAAIAADTAAIAADTVAIAADAADAIRRKVPTDDLGALDAKERAIARAKAKRDAIKDNGRKTFKKAKDTAKIGIAERGMRIFPSVSASVSPCLQTYPSCFQLQPLLTCFPCFDVLLCCSSYRTKDIVNCPLEFFHCV